MRTRTRQGRFPQSDALMEAEPCALDPARLSTRPSVRLPMLFAKPLTMFRSGLNGRSRGQDVFPCFPVPLLAVPLPSLIFKKEDRINNMPCSFVYNLLNFLKSLASRCSELVPFQGGKKQGAHIRCAGTVSHVHNRS